MGIRLGNPRHSHEKINLDALDTWLKQGPIIATDLQQKLYTNAVIMPEFRGIRNRKSVFSHPYNLARHA